MDEVVSQSTSQLHLIRKIEYLTYTSKAKQILFISLYIFFFQIVCRSDGYITNMVAKWPGFTHDSRLFSTSSLSRQLANGKRNLSLYLINNI